MFDLISSTVVSTKDDGVQSGFTLEISIMKFFNKVLPSLNGKLQGETEFHK